MSYATEMKQCKTLHQANKFIEEKTKQAKKKFMFFDKATINYDIINKTYIVYIGWSN